MHLLKVTTKGASKIVEKSSVGLQKVSPMAKLHLEHEAQKVPIRTQEGGYQTGQEEVEA